MVPPSLRLLLWLSSTAGGGRRGWAPGQLGCLAAIGQWPWTVALDGDGGGGLSGTQGAHSKTLSTTIGGCC